MKDGTGIPKSLFTGAKCPEVLTRFGARGAIQSDFHPSRRISINTDIKVDGVGNVGSLLPEKAAYHTTNHGRWHHVELGATDGSSRRRGPTDHGSKRQGNLRTQEKENGDGCEGSHLGGELL